MMQTQLLVLHVYSIEKQFLLMNWSQNKTQEQKHCGWVALSWRYQVHGLESAELNSSLDAHQSHLWHLERQTLD